MRRQIQRDADEADRSPFGINLAIGAVVVTAATILVGVFAAETPARLVLAAAAVGVFAAVVADTRASMLTGLIGFLLFDGFLVNRYGELSWNGTTTMWNLAVFALAVGLGLGQRWIRHALTRVAPTDDRLVHAPVPSRRQGT